MGVGRLEEEGNGIGVNTVLRLALEKLKGVLKEEPGQVERAIRWEMCQPGFIVSQQREKKEAKTRDKKDISSLRSRKYRQGRGGELHSFISVFSPFFFEGYSPSFGSCGDPVRVNEAAHFTAFSPIMSRVPRIGDGGGNLWFHFFLWFRTAPRRRQFERKKSGRENLPIHYTWTTSFIGLPTEMESQGSLPMFTLVPFVKFLSSKRPKKTRKQPSCRYGRVYWRFECASGSRAPPLACVTRFHRTYMSFLVWINYLHSFNLTLHYFMFEHFDSCKPWWIDFFANVLISHNSKKRRRWWNVIGVRVFFICHEF